MLDSNKAREVNAMMYRPTKLIVTVEMAIAIFIFVLYVSVFICVSLINTMLFQKGY